MDYSFIRLTGLNTIDLPILNAEHDDAWILKGVDGLGPAEIDVSISGDYFQNKVPRNKLIVMRIGLNPYWGAVGGTPSDLRELLYGTLTGGYTGDRIAVILMQDDPDVEVCRIYGYVSKFEMVPFSKDPQVQITIECLSPYFEAPAPVEPSLVTLDKLNPSIANVGSGPTGFYMKFTFAGLAAPLPYFEIQSQGGLRKMRFDPPKDFANGHSIEFNTNMGQRFIKFWQGADVNGLAWLTSDSDWLQLYGGDNVLTMSSDDFDWNGLLFTPKFWGV